MELQVSHVSLAGEVWMVRIGHCEDIGPLLEGEIGMYVRLPKELIERTVETPWQSFLLMDGQENHLEW